MKNLLHVDAEETHWPDRKVKVVTKLGANNSQYKAYMGIKEAELALALQVAKANTGISPGEIDGLIGLIEEYGEEKWEEGTSDARIED